MILELALQEISLGERQRKDYGDIQALADSIKKHGQMQNLLITADKRLIAGGRRFAAIALAGKPTAFCKVHEGPTDDLLLQELELEENIQRKDLSWQEREAAIAKMHDIKMKSNPDWNVDKTADLLGVSRRKVYTATELTAALEKGDQAVESADTPTTALKRLQAKRQLANRAADVLIRQQAVAQGTAPKLQARVETGDAVLLMQRLKDESQDFVFTNPPYGVDIEDVFIGNQTIYGQDDAETQGAFCQQLFKEAYRVLKPDRWFVTFYPTLRLEECRQFLAEAGFQFQGVPCIWIKPNKYMSTISDPAWQIGGKYETFFFARKGKAVFHRKPHNSNVFVYDTPGPDRFHKLQMPVDLWVDILEMIAVPGESGIEPCSGSGSGGRACIQLQLNYTGFELSPEYAAGSNVWLQEGLLGNSLNRLMELEVDDGE